MNSPRQRSCLHSAVALALYMLILNVQDSSSYDINLYTEGCHPFPENRSFYYQPPNTASTVTVNRCRVDCDLYEYSALWLGKVCTCFNEMDSTGVSTNLCSMTCNGHGGQRCGSNEMMNVYRSQLRDERVPTNISTTDGATENSTFDLTAWNTHKASINGRLRTEDKISSYLVEVCDGTDKPVDVAIYDSAAGTHSFALLRSSHTYELKSTVTSQDSSKLYSSAVVQTHLQLKDVNVTCPAYAASTKEIECLIRATGNKMTLALDFADGTKRNMYLGDTITEVVGSINDYGLSYASSVAANHIYFLPNFVFKHAGKLLGFKFHARRHDNSVIIKVYRPECTDKKQVYCYHSDSCIPFNSTCDGKNDTRSFKCASSNVWSFSLRGCVNSNGVEQYDNNRLIANVGGDRFAMVHEFSPTIKQNGWQTHSDSAHFEVQPGDMLGIFPGHSYGVISYVNRNKGARAYYRTVPDPAWLPTMTSTQNMDFLIEAYVARPVEVVVKKTYPDEVDFANVSVALTSEEDTDTTLTDNSYIDVQVEISGVSIISNYSGTTNESHVFIVPEHLGELPEYTVWFGDMSGVVTFSPHFNHTYTNAGVYKVITTADNAVSSMTNTTTVAIQDEILNLTLRRDYFVTALDNQSTLFINIDQGTNVTYTITVYDMTGNKFVLYHDTNNTDLPGEHLGEDNANGFNAYINYTFGATGNWTMRVEAENCISKLEALIWFKVEVPIVGLDIIDIAPVAYGNSTLVYFSIVNGTDITFYSRFDGHPTREWVMHEVGIVGHQYDDVRVLKATLIYNLMHDWIISGRVGPVPISVSDAEEFGLGEMVSQLAALGQSSLEMLAGPMEPVDTGDGASNMTDSDVISELMKMALSQRDKASVRCSRDLDGCSWHHGMAHLTLEDYNVTGPHTLELFAENIVQEATVNVSSTIWVEYIIEDLVMLANETFVKPGDIVLYNVTVSQLSRANSTIYYGDSHEEIEYRYEMLENDTIEFYHTFNESGNYTVELQSINNVSMANDVINMTVQDPVKALYLQTNSPVTRPWKEGGVAEIMFYWDPSEALLATDAFIAINYGNDKVSDKYFGVDDTLHSVTVSKTVPLSETHDWLMKLASADIVEAAYTDRLNSTDAETINTTNLYQIMAYRSLTEHQYWEFGDYNVSINISNLVSWQTWSTVIVVDEEVTELKIVSDIYNLTFGHEVRLDVTRMWGTRVNLTWDYMDSKPNETAAYKPKEDNFMLHTYDEAGVFWVVVTAVNSVGVWTAVLPQPIMVQTPVVGFSLECEHEMVLLEDPSWARTVSTYLFLDKKYPLATNATAVFLLDVEDVGIVPVELDVNDIYKACDKSKENQTHYHIHTIQHTYTIGSRRLLGVQIYNLVSNETYNDTLDVFVEIYNFTLSVKSAIVESDAEDVSKRLIGYGSGKDKFPLDQFVVVEIEYVRGSFINYTWSFGDDEREESYENKFITHKYAEVGWYTVKVNASNPLSRVSYEIRFQLQRGVGPVTIFTPTPLTRNTTIDLVVNPAWIGTDACYYIDFGATEYDSDLHFIYIFGDKKFCNDKYYAEIADNPNHRFNFDYDEIAARDQVDTVGTAEFTIPFNYLSVGLYTASITAMNEVSETTHTLTVGVTRGPCQWPKVDLAGNSPCLVDNLCATHFGQRVKQHFRSQMLEVKAYIEINCSSTDVYHHTWSLEEVNPVTGDIIRSVLNTELINSLGLIPDFYLPSSISNVVAPKNTLTYGLYRFSLNVRMDQEIGIEAIASVYIEIVKSYLKAGVVGGGFRRKGWGTNVTFDGLSQSYDPDYPDHKANFSCRWLCKRKNETWPIYDENYDKELRPFQITKPSFYYPDDSGGCFRDDTNSSGYFNIDPTMVDKTGCVFTIDFFYTYENETYEFKLIIEKDTRRKVLRTFVKITEGDPPEIDITSDSACLSNCGEKLNYAAKYTIEATVTNGRAGTGYNYEWDLFEVDGTDDDATPMSPRTHQFGHPLKTREKHLVHKCSEFVGLSDESIEAMRASHGRYIDFCKAASTGVNRKAITIEKDFFSALDAVTTYFMYVKVYRPRTVNFGETYRTFYINTPPIAGACVSDPANGTALVTGYNVRCLTPCEDEHKPIRYEITTAGSKCCQDNPSAIPTWKYFFKGNNPYAYVTNTENKGGIMTQGDKNNDFKKWLRVRCFDSIGSWTDNYIQTIVLPAPREVIAAEAAKLKNAGGSSAYSDPDTANNKMGALAGTMNEPISNCTECARDMFVDNATKEYEKDRHDECLEEQKSCLAYEEEERRATREAMLTQTGKNTPNTAEGCGTKSATLMEVSGNPRELSEDTQDQVSAQTGQCVGVIANSEDPPDPQTVDSFATNAIATCGSTSEATKQSQQDEADEIAGQAPQDQHAVFRRRRKRSSGKTAQQTQLELLELVDNIGGVLGTSKAAGESPSKFSTPSMNLAVNKAWGDSAANVPADDGNGFNLPDSGSLFPDANDTSQVIMSSKVISQPKNPFVGKNATDNNTLEINSAVVMLSLTNASGAPLDMGNVSKPTHIFIKRDAADVNVNTLVNVAGEHGNKADKTPFTIHKVRVPPSSSLHVRIVQTWVFNTTNCSAVNLTYADNETLAYCNWTSTMEATPQPTWLDVTTNKPTTVVTPFTTTTMDDVTTTTNMPSTTTGTNETTTPDPTTTTGSPGNLSLGLVTTDFFIPMTPSWIVESTNKTGWVLIIGVGAKPSLARPDSYISCELPMLNDPIKILQRDIRMSNANPENVSSIYNGTDGEGVPEWMWNLPAKLERDLDTCFYSNSFFNSRTETEVYIGIKYIPPRDTSGNVSDWLHTTTPPPVRKRREAATAATTANVEATTATVIESMVEKIFYQLEFYTAQCKVWNHYIQDWETSGCEVGPYSSPTNTHCVCTKLARDKPSDWVEPAPNIDPVSGEVIPQPSAPPMSFGAALAVPMNEIDMSGAAFANLGENPLVFSVMVSIMCAYLCLCIWCRSADLKDEIKASTSPLLDNDPRDKYHYEFIVYTGSHSGSGTTAKVSMILSGDEDETPPRLIFDDKKPVLQRGGIDSFIMSVPNCLGSLNVARIWHDNSGSKPSWNLSRIQVTDLQNGEKFFFVLDRWLAVDQDDGCIDRVIPAAGKDELTNFNLIFWNKARKDITDGHIWFSVFGRPPRSRFTRIQRVTCCLSLIFCTMFANIMFYEADDSTAPPASAIKLGPIEFTVTQLLTGIYASLMVFPVNIIIVMAFRYSGQRQKSLPKAIREKKKEDERMLTQSTLELRQQAELLGGENSHQLLTGLDTTAVDDWGASNSADGKKKKKKFMLPWWFIFVAYLMCLGSVGWCFYAVVSVAFTFGPVKAAEWLGSFCMSFVESVFFTQPLKVLGLAAFYALVIKTPAVEDEDERDPDLQKDEVYIHEHKRSKDINNPRFRKKLRNFTKIPLPPSEEYLKAARQLRLKEVKMMNILKEIAIYLTFIYLLLMVGYGNRDPWAHNFYTNVKNLVAHGHWSPNNAGYDISNVKDYGTFYRWLENTLLASYYSTRVYDGQRHWWTTNFSSDYNSVPVGIPRLRLLRTKDAACAMPVYIYSKTCGIDYTMSDQDETSYKAGWIPVNQSDPRLSTPDEGFFYNTSSSLNGFITSGSQATYSGGGYVYELSHKQSVALQRVKHLKKMEWLNPQTRAVFVEFNLYNSAINLFAVSYILFEFLSTGAIQPYYKVQIFRLDRYIGSQALTVMVAEILTTMFFIFYLVREIKAIKRLKRDYFKSAWNIFEMCVLAGCFFSVVLYFARLYICLTTMSRFRENKKAFHNFQMAAGIDELYGFCMSFILFAATIKFTKLLRFNKRIMTLAISMVAILKPLASFGLVFSITFFAFAQMSYMVFVNNLLEFSTFIASSETLFSMMLNKFDYPTLERANPLFAPIIFLAFVLMMTLTLLNFMLTIILDTYTEVKDELMQQENEYQIVDFITNKVKGLVGMAPPPNLPKMRNEGSGFVDDKDEELSSRVEELMEKFMDIVTSDPQQRELSDEIEQRKKYLRKGVGIKRKIVSG